MRDLMLLFVLIVAAALIVGGFSMWSVPAAFIVGGIAVAAIGFLWFDEVEA